MMRVNEAYIKKLAEHIKRQIEVGMIEQTSSAYRNPMFVIPKKDGSLRMIVDLQTLNSFTLKDAHTAPMPDDITE